jgi:regulation of enolase protein 1 (concanavalin A-like superfamily)
MNPMGNHMARASFLLAVSVAAVAAPAPVYKPDSSRWFGIADWDNLVDPSGACRLDGGGGKLTIRLPAGKGHGFDKDKSWLSAPRLLRAVDGDFAAQVRVDGDFILGRRAGEFRGAGIFLTDGERHCLVARLAKRGALRAFDGCYGSAGTAEESESFVPRRSPKGRAVYLRLERRGDGLTMEASRDGVSWTRIDGWDSIKLARKVKVGVVVAADAMIGFHASFDDFKLTPLPPN